MWRPSLPAAVVMSLCLACAARAQAAANPYAARIARACESMGLNPSEAPYAFCEMSLEDSSAAITSAQADAVARRACARSGLRIGSAALANCVLDREAGLAEFQPTEPLPASAGRAKPMQSYQRRDQTTSVARACADLGLVPGSEAFESCVGNLGMTMDNANMVGTD